MIPVCQGRVERAKNTLILMNNPAASSGVSAKDKVDFNRRKRRGIKPPLGD